MLNPPPIRVPLKLSLCHVPLSLLSLCQSIRGREVPRILVNLFCSPLVSLLTEPHCSAAGHTINESHRINSYLSGSVTSLNTRSNSSRLVSGSATVNPRMLLGEERFWETQFGLAETVAAKAKTAIKLKVRIMNSKQKIQLHERI